MTFTNESGVLTIALSGRIDSTNAAVKDQEIETIRTENDHQSLVFDVENLEYISSAGLRIILRLLKSEKDFKIINASTDVYEIFDMTGFTEMLNVQKAYRRISVEGCEAIGQGANGIVYRTAPDTIVKVYRNPDCLPDIHHERELARKAFVLGVPTAIPFDVVKVGDSYGSVFELLDAQSLAKLVIDNPENIDYYIGLSVDLLKKIHSTLIQPEDMPNEKEAVLSWANFMMDYLPENKVKKLVSMVQAIPENHHMMHGDLHFKNILLQNGEVLLIDMDTLCYGDPIFEFANIYNAYCGFGDYDHSNIERFLGFSYETAQYIWRKTLSLYFNTEDESVLHEIEQKAKLIGYVRLARRGIRRGSLKAPGKKKETEYWINQILELIDNLDTLEV